MPQPPYRQKLSTPLPVDAWRWVSVCRARACVSPSASLPSELPLSRPVGFGQLSVPGSATTIGPLVFGAPGPVAFEAVTVHVSELPSSAIWTL